MREGITARTPTIPGKRARGRFLQEVFTELQKVKWPSREDVTQLTSVVLATILFVGLYLAVLDAVLSRVFQFIGLYGNR